MLVDFSIDGLNVVHANFELVRCLLVHFDLLVVFANPFLQTDHLGLLLHDGPGFIIGDCVMTLLDDFIAAAIAAISAVEPLHFVSQIAVFLPQSHQLIGWLQNGGLTSSDDLRVVLADDLLLRFDIGVGVDVVMGKGAFVPTAVSSGIVQELVVVVLISFEHVALSVV